MKKQVFSLGASLAVLATMALSGFGAAAEGATVFSDDFERDTLGDTYTSTADEAAVGVKDGQLVFKNNVDGTGVFVKLPEALGDSYALSFDFKQGETSTALAVMVGLTDVGNPSNYWTAGTTRIALAPTVYNVGDPVTGGGQLLYTPGSGLDTDAANAGAQCWWRPGYDVANMEEGQFLNIRLVFDKAGDKTAMRMYYKLNTDPDWMLYVEHSSWVGVESAGYIGFLSQGAAADFAIDNLRIDSVVPQKLDLKENSGKYAFSDTAVTEANGKISVAYKDSLRTVKALTAAVTCEDATVTPVVLDADGQVVTDENAALATGMSLGLFKNNVVFVSVPLEVAAKPADPTTSPSAESDATTAPTTATTPAGSDSEAPATGAALPFAALALTALAAGALILTKKARG